MTDYSMRDYVELPSPSWLGKIEVLNIQDAESLLDIPEVFEQAESLLKKTAWNPNQAAFMARMSAGFPLEHRRDIIIKFNETVTRLVELEHQMLQFPLTF